MWRATPPLLGNEGKKPVWISHTVVESQDSAQDGLDHGCVLICGCFVDIWYKSFGHSAPLLPHFCNWHSVGDNIPRRTFYSNLTPSPCIGLREEQSPDKHKEFLVV